MEFFVGLILVIALIAAIILFKKPIKKSATWLDDNLTTTIDEASVELTKRSMDAYADLIETCGKDYMTPSEIYDLMHKRRKRNAFNSANGHN